MPSAPTLLLVLASSSGFATAAVPAPRDGLPIGLFTAHCDVGSCAHPGAVAYDEARRRYTIAGGGENMWFTNDAFHFAWNQVSGDVALSANITFLGSGGNAHRKACLLLRQSLSSDSAYADAALHGDGLASLQYREDLGSRTYEIQASVSAPRWLRIEKLGNYVAMSWSPDAKKLAFVSYQFR